MSEDDRVFHSVVFSRLMPDMILICHSVIWYPELISTSNAL